MKNFFYKKTAIIIIVVILLLIDYQYSNGSIQQPSALVEISFDNSIKTTNETWQHIVDLSSGNVQQIEFTMVDHQGNKTEVVGGKTFEDNQKIIISQIKEELFDEMTHTNYGNKENYTDLKFTKITLLISERDYKKLSEINNIIITNRNNNLIIGSIISFAKKIVSLIAI